MLLLDWLAGLPYLQAGIAVGLLQGYVFLLAEICHSIGFYTVEGELRSFLPARRHANLVSTSLELCHLQWHDATGPCAQSENIELQSVLLQVITETWE